MKLKQSVYILIAFSTIFGACKRYLDVPPVNLVQNKDIFANSTSMAVYMSRLYSQMPFEDFKYSPGRQFFDDWLVTPGANDGASIGRDAGEAMTSEGFFRNGAYWTRAFNLLRDANMLLEAIPEFKANFNTAEYNHFVGEAYFSRAMVFYALAKRYGGVPLVTKVLQYPENTAAQLEVKRSTEEETWNQVLKDYDSAVAMLASTSPKRGYANKAVALAFKSEAMLFAGSVAKYNKVTGFGQKTNVRVIGFDPATAPAASAKYFKEAYMAAREVMKLNRYSLYKKKWSATDKEGQYQNMVDMFSDITSAENIYIKEYKFPDLAHGYDSYNIPRQLMGGNGYSAGNCPTLDFVELFDGFDKNPDGTIKVLDASGKYILFDKITDLFKNAEPRLKAYVILPGEIFKGEAIDIRRGIYTGDASGGIAPLRVVNGSAPNYSVSGPNNYNQVDAYTAKGAFASGKKLFLSPNGSTHEVVNVPGMGNLNAAGKSGPFSADNTAAMTGFVVRKWLNPNMPQSLVLESRSEQPFVLMRYAEILLNAAEAANELLSAGQTIPGENMQQVAFEAIRDIRERAGADPLVGGAASMVGPSGLAIIRKERKKELAFEHKTLWDIRRWRTQHSEVLNGFTQSDGAFYRGLYPFLSSTTGKYFFDAGLEEARKRFRLIEQEYYLAIPGGEVSKSPVIDQQPGR